MRTLIDTVDSCPPCFGIETLPTNIAGTSDKIFKTLPPIYTVSLGKHVDRKRHSLDYNVHRPACIVSLRKIESNSVALGLDRIIRVKRIFPTRLICSVIYKIRRIAARIMHSFFFFFKEGREI